MVVLGAAAIIVRRVDKAKRAHQITDALIDGGHGARAPSPPYDCDDETVLNRAKKRFSALAAVQGVKKSCRVAVGRPGSRPNRRLASASTKPASSVASR